MRIGRRLGWIACLGAWSWAGTAVAVAGDDPAGVAFFEAKIRPVLVRECYSCHSAGAKTLKGGLRLDSRAGVFAGGDSGPAVVAGKPGESPLLDALRYDGIEMPPEGKLPDAVVADFARWIEIGAPDPRLVESKAPAAAKTGLSLDAGRGFWSYKPPRHHAAPTVADASWPRGDIDRFLLAAIEAKGLTPGPDADRSTLLRRLSFDLTGLPPSPEDLAAFEADPSPDAYERRVDLLLASPRFGERWGRHWLDLARFAESLTLRGFIFKEAWRYRDYVIDAFNADLPYDQFVREQVAGDLLPAGSIEDRRRGRVAATFLVLGNTNLEDQDKVQLEMDVVDEQIDVLSKALLAQTIACARCHDHKFDPIPTADYYAIAAILKGARALDHDNVSKWIETPLPVEPARKAEQDAHDREVAALDAGIKAERARLDREGRTPARGIVAPRDLPGVVVDDAGATRIGRWVESKHSGTYIGAGYLHDGDDGKGGKSLTFDPDLPAAGTYEVRLAYTPGTNRASVVPVTILSGDGEKTVKVDLRGVPPIDGRYVSLGRYSFEKNGQGYVQVSNEGTRGHVVADAVAFIPADHPSLTAPKSAGSDTLARLEGESKRRKASAPPRDRAMGLVETGKVVPMRIHVRGSVHTLGEVVPRGVLRVATVGPPPAMPPAESGRRELAGWIASADNPLTARVFVNRAWHWLFGVGLVRTVDNFGTTGETPSHPELLDELALGFVRDGWSVKRLVRRIVTSRAYRVSATPDPKAVAADPENRLLARANRRRLDAECLRDAMLSAGGNLSVDMGGPTFPATLAADYGFKATDTRRSVYTPAFRNALPEVFEAFDFADPSTVTGRRDASTVAPQALFFLNSPFVLDQSRLTARRLLSLPGLDDARRVDRAYRLALGRSPTDRERAVALRLVAPGDAEESWSTLVQSLFASADFRSID